MAPGWVGGGWSSMPWPQPPCHPGPATPSSWYPLFFFHEMHFPTHHNFLSSGKSWASSLGSSLHELACKYQPCILWIHCCVCSSTPHLHPPGSSCRPVCCVLGDRKARLPHCQPRQAKVWAKNRPPRLTPGNVRLSSLTSTKAGHPRYIFYGSRPMGWEPECVAEKRPLGQPPSSWFLLWFCVGVWIVQLCYLSRQQLVACHFWSIDYKHVNRWGATRIQ